MTELGRDARALVARVKRQDGPSAADRVRLRRKLEPVWAAQRAESLAAAAEVAPRVGHGWMSWFSGLLLMSLGFVTPEVPRAIAPAAELAAAPAPAPGVQASSAAAVVADDSPREQPLVAQQIAAAFARAVEPAPAAGRPQRRRVRARNGALLAVPQPEAANELVLEAPATPSSQTEAPATHEVRTRVEETSATAPAPVRPLAATGGSTSLARGEQFAPNVSSHAFKAQPIDDELTWLSAAQEALRKNQPSSALRLVQEHAFRFPQGALASERVAVQALALCALSRKAAAREVLSDLEHRAPNSPLLARVRRNCGF